MEGELMGTPILHRQSEDSKKKKTQYQVLSLTNPILQEAFFTVFRKSNGIKNEKKKIDRTKGRYLFKFEHV